MEVVVAVVLIAIVSAPISYILISTVKTSNLYHMRAEATDLATQALETAEYQTANGTSPTSGTTTTTQTSGGDPFKVAVTYQLVAGTGVGPTLCTAPAGTTSSKIWSVEATVSWGQGTEGEVNETTLVSPSYADLADLNAAELAVPVYTPLQTLETQNPINITVQGSCNGGCGTIPSGESLSETANTGTSGCAVFPDLFSGNSVTYTVTASSNSGWVDPYERSDAATAPGDPTVTDISVQANQVTALSISQAFVMAQGAAVGVQFQTTAYGGSGGGGAGSGGSGGSGGSSGGGSAGPAASTSTTTTTTTSTTTTTTTQPVTSILPAAYLPISVEASDLLCSNQICPLGNATNAGGFSSSTAQTALLFPGPSTTPNYSIWAGNAADSDPGYDNDYGTDVPTSATVGSSSLTVTLPVYPLTLTNITGTPSLTAQDVTGGSVITLNAVSGGKSATGLPLGQFEIFQNGSQTPSVYVWITPSGVCSSSSQITSICSSPSTGSVAI